MSKALDTILQFKNDRLTEYGASKHDLFFCIEDDVHDGTHGSVEEAIEGYPPYKGLTVAEYNEWHEAQIEHAKELAACGRMYLDENFPDWREDINAQRLDMADGMQCVLGQMFGDYDYGIQAIYEREHMGREDREVWAKNHGFLQNGATYFALDEAWQEELAKGKGRE